MEAAGHGADISLEPDCQDTNFHLNTLLTSLCLGFPVGAAVPRGLTVWDKMGYTHTVLSTAPELEMIMVKSMGLGGLTRST